MMNERILKEKERIKKIREKEIIDGSFAFRTAQIVLKSKMFEAVFTGLILGNIVLVVIETDAVARDEEAPVWVDVAGWMVLISFVFEVGFRICVLGREFFNDAFSTAEFLLVAADLLMNMLISLTGTSFSISLLRVIRLLKLARAAKVFKVFPELRIMVAGLMGSVRAICWGTVLVVFMLLIWAVIAVQFINPVNVEIAEAGKYEGCDRCPHAYDSVFNAFMTFSQQIVAGDSWGTPTMTVIEHQPSTGLFFALVLVTVGMAALNLILGVVVDIAGQSREQLLEEISNENILEQITQKTNLIQVFDDMDTDNNGVITRDELDHAYAESDLFKKCISSFDMGEEDLNVLWNVLDSDRSGIVSISEFATSIYKMKSSATDFMLAYVKYYVTEIKDHICRDLESTKQEIVLGLQGSPRFSVCQEEGSQEKLFPSGTTLDDVRLAMKEVSQDAAAGLDGKTPEQLNLLGLVPMKGSSNGDSTIDIDLGIVPTSLPGKKLQRIIQGL